MIALGHDRPLPSHADRAITYAQRCVAGQEVVCAETIQACQRFLDDLRREGWRWAYSRMLANSACEFIERLPIIDGGEDRDIRLDDWQCFVVCNIFGWVGREATGQLVRRFTYATLFIGRGNGKSFLFSAIALYVMFGLGQYGAEGYCAATMEKTAKVVFDTCSQMVRLRPEFFGPDRLGVSTFRDELRNDRACVLRPVSSQAKSNFGQRMALGIIDELHEVDNRLYAALSKGLGKRKDGLLFSITTAGYRDDGLAKEKYDLVRDILGGRVKNERHFCCIWQAESAEDLSDQREWRKANPALGRFLDPEILTTELADAVSHQAKLDFIIFRLNRFAGNVVQSWLRPGKWDELYDEDLRLEDFKGQPVYIGCDLAFMDDLCSKVYAFPIERDDGLHFAVFQRSYLSEAAIKQQKLGKWVGEAGPIIAAEGETVTPELILKGLKDDIGTYDVRGVVFDPWHAKDVWSRLDGKVPFFELPQKPATFSEPIKHAEGLILQNRVHHDGDPLFAWAIGNATLVKTEERNCRLQKEKRGSDKKIDPAIALVCALSEAEHFGESSGPMVVEWI